MSCEGEGSAASIAFTKRRFPSEEIMPSARTGEAPSGKRRIPAPPPALEAAPKATNPATSSSLSFGALRRQNDAIVVEQAHRKEILAHDLQCQHEKLAKAKRRKGKKSNENGDEEDDGPNKAAFAHLNFLSGKPAWNPSGTSSSSIGGLFDSPRLGTPTNSKRSPSSSSERSPSTKKVSEPSARLLSSPRRVELSAKLPIAADKKQVDVAKVTARMQQHVDLWQAKQKKKREEEEKRRAEEEKSKHPQRDDDDENDGGKQQKGGRKEQAPLTEAEERLLRRLIDEPLAQREGELAKLTLKLCPSVPRTPKINTSRNGGGTTHAADAKSSKKASTTTTRTDEEEQQGTEGVKSPPPSSSWTRRLYDQGLARQQQSTERAVKKYIDDVKPQFAHRTEAERVEYTSKLVKNEPR